MVLGFKAGDQHGVPNEWLQFAIYFILVIDILEHLSGADPTEVVLVSRECKPRYMLLLIIISPTSADL